MNDEEFLKSKGWSTWYSDNYWVNKKVIVDETVQDYTNYGVTKEEALRIEREEPDLKWSSNYMGLRVRFKPSENGPQVG